MTSARDALSHRLQELRDAPGYRNYLRVREHVLDMKDRQNEASGVGAPSDYWRMELDYLDFMLDASPIVIAALRSHSFAITNVRPYDYRTVTGKSGRRPGFEAKLDALRGIATHDLLVAESPVLGGFGYEIDGSLYNVDTLKFYEVLIGLERAGVLERFRRGDAQCLCEIGSGWGGFAYQFKTLFPNATMILVDFPEMFLFSATYLMTAFPDAKVAFWGDAETQTLNAFDFVFVANDEIDSFAPPRLDLTVNMVSFQEMTTEQVRSYVSWAQARGSRDLYSLNRDRSPYNPELTNVRDLIAEAYDVTELDLLPVSYTKIVDPWAAKTKDAKPGKPGKPTKVKVAKEVDADHLDYRHVAGVLRDAA